MRFAYDTWMQPPQMLAALTPRGIDEIAAAAHAVQANVVALRVAWCRISGQAPEDHEIRTPAPGPVRRLREILIDRHVLKDYSPEEILLRLRQVWGEFCALCWLFPHVDPQKPVCFDPLPAGQTTRCVGHVLQKLGEVQTGLWRLLHEQKLRQRPELHADPQFRRDHESAMMHPMQVFGTSISTCSDVDLFCCSCEYAGMLAALRWTTDNRWAWEAPGIMDVTLPSPP